MLRHIDSLHSLLDNDVRRDSNQLETTISLDDLYTLSDDVRIRMEQNWNLDDLDTAQAWDDLKAIAEQESKKGNIDPKTITDLVKMLSDRPIVDALSTIVELERTNKKIDSRAVFLAFLRLAEQRRNELSAQPPEDMRHIACTNHQWLLRNKYQNVLRLVGVLDPVDYDVLHRNHMYLFTTNPVNTLFSDDVTAYRNGQNKTVSIIEDKRILTLGAGNGRDERNFVENGAGSVHMIEGSPYMMGKLEETKQRITEALQGRFIPPSTPKNMLREPRRRADAGETVDTVYGHSCLHYFDNETLLGLLRSIREALKKDGHLAFAIKAPGAILDGNGIPIVDDHEHLLGRYETTERVYKRAWLNHDGQIRYFRDQTEWERIAGQVFERRQFKALDVENYETTGHPPQTFYGFIFKNSF